MTKDELYLRAIELAKKFLDVNCIAHPIFMRYSEMQSAGESARKRMQYVYQGPTQGTGTGYYYDGHLFVNVPRTAAPVNRPCARSWSYPCWKTDRTAVGVVAHEIGHHIEVKLAERGLLSAYEHGPAWRELIYKVKKQVSGYEPVASEAWAESIRLFILNPELLKLGIPQRYEFITKTVGLKPSESRPWREVLGNHPDYVRAGVKWIAIASRWPAAQQESLI
jgi:hypothetical protein